MKNFLKPLLTFACMTLLFAACTTDDDASSTDYASMVNEWIASDADHNNLHAKLLKFLNSKNAQNPVFEVSNIKTVTQGNAKSPSFTITEPMELFCVYTYHWNYITVANVPEIIYSWVEDVHGRAYGKNGATHWQYGQGKKEKAGWYTFPLVTIPAGTYTVKCSSPQSWSYNSNSDGYGFCTIYGLQVKEGETPNTDPSQQAWNIETLRIRGTIHGTSPNVEGGAPQQLPYDIYFTESNTIKTKLQGKSMHVEAQMEKSFMGTINTKLTFDIENASMVSSKKAVIRNLKLEQKTTNESNSYTTNTSTVYTMDKIPMTAYSSGNYVWGGNGSNGVDFGYNSTIVMSYTGGSQTTKYSLHNTPTNSVLIEMTLAQ